MPASLATGLKHCATALICFQKAQVLTPHHTPPLPCPGKAARTATRRHLYLDVAMCSRWNKIQVADFTYQTNITDYNYKIKADLENNDGGIKIVAYPWEDFNDPDLLRQASKYGLLSRRMEKAAFQAYDALNLVSGKMLDTYSNEKVCNYTDRSKCDIPFYTDLRDVFRNSDDPDEMKYYWLTYQDQISRDIKPFYADYVKRSNEYAKFFNYSNRADQWIGENEEPPVAEFADDMIKLYEQFKPMYLQMHAYVRKRLFDYYGPCVINRTGPIPLHLTGSVNAETFIFIAERTKPYPKRESTSATPQIQKLKYKPRKFAEICDDFYQSLGLPALPDTFWNYSMFEKPTDGRVVDCASSAWDMNDKKDFRVKMCAEPIMDDLVGMCHETGHLQYFIGYSEQPCCYRTANKAINEGVADVAGLSLVTTKRLKKLGLLENPDQVDHEVEMNRLYLSAVDKFAFLPYGLIVDLWRWKYFRGEIDETNANKAWWELRLDFQGMSPPAPRPDDGLDPASKIHVIDINSQYIIYFLDRLIQFQMQEALCIAAGEYKPDDPDSQSLSQCDIYGSKEAGHLLKQMYRLGYSKPWPDSLEAITGKRALDAQPIINYYAELFKWIEAENKRTGEVIGW